MAGLARRIHDSSPLKEKFDQLINENEDLEGDQRALTHRVPTRWNSDLACLMSHFHFKDVVEQLTSVSSLKLKSYRLSVEQWKMAEDVREVLLVRIKLLVFRINIDVNFSFLMHQQRSFPLLKSH